MGYREGCGVPGIGFQFLKRRRQIFFRRKRPIALPGYWHVGRRFNFAHLFSALLFRKRHLLEETAGGRCGKRNGRQKRERYWHSNHFVSPGYEWNGQWQEL